MKRQIPESLTFTLGRGYALLVNGEEGCEDDRDCIIRSFRRELNAAGVGDFADAETTCPANCAGAIHGGDVT